MTCWKRCSLFTTVDSGSFVYFFSEPDGRLAMLKLLDPSSDLAASSEIADLFAPPTTQLAVSSSKFLDYTPVNPLSHTPIEFNITPSKAFLDLQSSYLYVRVRIVDDTGAQAKAPAGGEAKFALLNYFSQTFVKQIQVSIGHESVYDSGVNHHFTSYLTTLLSYDELYKSSILAAGGWATEEDSESENCKGFKARVKTCENGEIEFCSRLAIPLFSQPKALLPYTSMRIVIYPNPSDILIQQRGGTARSLHVSFEDVRLSVRHLFVHDSTLIQLQSMVAKAGGVTYPLRHLSSRTFYLSAGRRSVPEFSLYLTTIPRRVFVALVPAASFNGSYTNNVFAFKHYELTNLSIETSGGETFPARPHSIDFKNGRYSRIYYEMMDNLHLVGSGDSNGLTLASFAKTCPIFVIDLGCSRDPSVQLIKQGETSIRASFGSEIPAGGAYLIAISEFDQSLHLNEGIAKIDLVA